MTPRRDSTTCSHFEDTVTPHPKLETAASVPHITTRALYGYPKYLHSPWDPAFQTTEWLFFIEWDVPRSACLPHIFFIPVLPPSLHFLMVEEPSTPVAVTSLLVSQTASFRVPFPSQRRLQEVETKQVLPTPEGHKKRRVVCRLREWGGSVCRVWLQPESGVNDV